MSPVIDFPFNALGHMNQLMVGTAGSRDFLLDTDSSSLFLLDAISQLMEEKVGPSAQNTPPQTTHSAQAWHIIDSVGAVQCGACAAICSGVWGAGVVAVLHAGAVSIVLCVKFPVLSPAVPARWLLPCMGWVRYTAPVVCPKAHCKQCHSNVQCCTSPAKVPSRLRCGGHVRLGDLSVLSAVSESMFQSYLLSSVSFKTQTCIPQECKLYLSCICHHVANRHSSYKIRTTIVTLISIRGISCLIIITQRNQSPADYKQSVVVTTPSETNVGADQLPARMDYCGGVFAIQAISDIRVFAIVSDVVFIFPSRAH